MTKDDYFILVYRILSRLYLYFKSGASPDISTFDADALKINRGYWANIMESLSDEGYIRGLMFCRLSAGVKDIKIIDLKITKSGIEYLQENSMMKKAYGFLKDVADIIPGI